MKMIAVSNLKGGVGKTTLVTNLGAILAQKGYRVLLVDTGSQGHVSVSFGLKHSVGLWELMMSRAEPQEVTYEVSDGLDIIPSDRRSGVIEQLLVSVQSRDKVLGRRLEAMDEYDFVLFDTGPSLSLLLQNAFVCSRNILIPISMDYLAVLGGIRSIELARMLQRTKGAKCGILGIVPTFVNKGRIITGMILDHLDQVFTQHSIRVFSPIRVDTNIQKASIERKPIVTYKRSSRGSKDFAHLAGEIVDSLSSRSSTPRIRPDGDPGPRR